MYSPINARKMLGTVATDLPSNDSLWIRTYKTVEVKTNTDAKHSHIQLCAKLSTLMEIAEILPMRQDYKVLPISI